MAAKDIFLKNYMPTNIRTTLHKLMQETLADELKHHDWTYKAIRPLAVPPHWKVGQRIVGDCSKGVQYLCRWAGGPDPMGNNFGLWGNSTTLCSHLQHLASPGELEVGDIVTFGSWGNDHAAMVIEKGHDPLLWSFGHQGAPDTYRLSQDRRPHQLLRYPVPKYVPTPQDKLRAKTGYFAWVAWKLGEGDWTGFNPATPNVRPHVPKLISPVWWRRYAAFLLNRKKGNQATK